MIAETMLAARVFPGLANLSLRQDWSSAGLGAGVICCAEGLGS